MRLVRADSFRFICCELRLRKTRCVREVCALFIFWIVDIIVGKGPLHENCILIKVFFLFWADIIQSAENHRTL
jgi:hypothetical protein